MNATATGHDEATLEIQIVGGLNKGAKLSLNLGDYAVGSTPSADIVIRDPDVAAEHAIVRIDRYSVHIEAVGGDIAVGDRLIQQGHGCRVRMPATVTIGSARLEMNRLGEASGVPEALQPVSQFITQRPLVVAGGVVICALAFSVASRGLPVFPEPKAPFTTGSVTGEKVTAEIVKEASDKLKEKLLSAGVTSLKVTATQDKHVNVTGGLSKRDTAAWASAAKWFDETYGSRIVLTPSLNVSEKNSPAFRLQAVWYGERPYVIMEDGSHYYEGAMLDSGWHLQRIAEDRIVLQRDGESLALTYR